MMHVGQRLHAYATMRVRVRECVRELLSRRAYTQAIGGRTSSSTVRSLDHVVRSDAKLQAGVHVAHADALLRSIAVSVEFTFSASAIATPAASPS